MAHGTLELSLREELVEKSGMGGRKGIFVEQVDSHTECCGVVTSAEDSRPSRRRRHHWPGMVPECFTEKAVHEVSAALRKPREGRVQNTRK